MGNDSIQENRKRTLEEVRRRKMEEEKARRKKYNRIMLIVSIVIIVAALAVVLVSVLSNVDFSPKMKDIDFSQVDLSKCQVSQTETDYVLMTIKDHGQVLIRLYPKVAPLTVKNFKNLVSKGFYDGLTFHRIVDGFMAQGGDPQGNGNGGSGTTIKGEFKSNGVNNNLSHVRGVVSMARGSDSMDSASSQFFICYDDVSSTLDGKYASFGYVCAGMDVMDGLLEVERTMNSLGERATPVEPVIIESMQFVTVKG